MDFFFFFFFFLFFPGWHAGAPDELICSVYHHRNLYGCTFNVAQLNDISHVDNFFFDDHHHDHC